MALLSAATSFLLFHTSTLIYSETSVLRYDRITFVAWYTKQILAEIYMRVANGFYAHKTLVIWWRICFRIGSSIQWRTRLEIVRFGRNRLQLNHIQAKCQWTLTHSHTHTFEYFICFGWRKSASIRTRALRILKKIFSLHFSVTSLEKICFESLTLLFFAFIHRTWKLFAPLLLPQSKCFALAAFSMQIFSFHWHTGAIFSFPLWFYVSFSATFFSLPKCISTLIEAIPRKFVQIRCEHTHTQNKTHSEKRNTQLDDFSCWKEKS